MCLRRSETWREKPSLFEQRTTVQDQVLATAAMMSAVSAVCDSYTLTLVACGYRFLCETQGGSQLSGVFNNSCSCAAILN